MSKIYKLTQAEYRKKLRNEDRLEKLKDLVEKAHQITRQIQKRKKVSTSK